MVENYRENAQIHEVTSRPCFMPEHDRSMSYSLSARTTRCCLRNLKSCYGCVIHVDPPFAELWSGNDWNVLISPRHNFSVNSAQAITTRTVDGTQIILRLINITTLFALVPHSGAICLSQEPPTTEDGELRVSPVPLVSTVVLMVVSKKFRMRPCVPCARARPGVPNQESVDNNQLSKSRDLRGAINSPQRGNDADQF